jgi:hypothetical protein
MPARLIAGKRIEHRLHVQVGTIRSARRFAGPFRTFSPDTSDRSRTAEILPWALQTRQTTAYESVKFLDGPPLHTPICNGILAYESGATSQRLGGRNQGRPAAPEGCGGAGSADATGFGFAAHTGPGFQSPFGLLAAARRLRSTASAMMILMSASVRGRPSAARSRRRPSPPRPPARRLSALPRDPVPDGDVFRERDPAHVFLNPLIWHQPDAKLEEGFAVCD